MTEVKSKPIQKDSAVADLGDALASTLAAMRPGDSMDILQRTDPPVQTQVAADIGPKPQNFYEHGLGSGRAPAGISPTRLEREPLGIPGHGMTTPAQSTTTSRADSLAVESDFRVGGNDEGGTFSAADKPVDRGTLPVPDPLMTDRSSGGPKIGSDKDTNTRRPTSHRHPGEEEGAP
jgi:hypothetical protein